MGLLVKFFWLIEQDGWEPEEPVEEGPFEALRLEGSKLVVPATGEVLAAMDGQDCWVRPKDPAGLRWSDFSITPQDGLLKAVFWSEGSPALQFLVWNGCRSPMICFGGRRKGTSWRWPPEEGGNTAAGCGRRLS